MSLSLSQPSRPPRSASESPKQVVVDRGNLCPPSIRRTTSVSHDDNLGAHQKPVPINYSQPWGPSADLNWINYDKYFTQNRGGNVNLEQKLHIRPGLNWILSILPIGRTLMAREAPPENFSSCTLARGDSGCQIIISWSEWREQHWLVHTVIIINCRPSPAAVLDQADNIFIPPIISSSSSSSLYAGRPSCTRHERFCCCSSTEGYWISLVSFCRTFSICWYDREWSSAASN